MESCLIGTHTTSSYIFLIKQEKTQKYWTPRKIQKGKSKIKRQNQKSKHIKRRNNNCHIPDLVKAFSNVENGGLNLVL